MLETVPVPARVRMILDISDTLHEALRIAAEVARVPLAQHIGSVLRNSERIECEPTSGLRRRDGEGKDAPLRKPKVRRAR